MQATLPYDEAVPFVRPSKDGTVLLIGLVHLGLAALLGLLLFA